MTRLGWVVKREAMPVVQQCRLAGVARATFHARQRPKPLDESDLLISRLLDEQYTRRPFYGSRKMAVFLKAEGHTVNRQQGAPGNLRKADRGPGRLKTK